MTGIIVPDNATLAEMGFPAPSVPAPAAQVQYQERAPVSRAQVDAWNVGLCSVVPKLEQLPYLYLRWEPGDIWQPVQRFVIWELLPHAATPDHIWTALKGPHPRSSGHYDLQQKRWVGGPQSARMIDRGTWEVFQETGRWGIRWWVVQGKTGGHPINMPWMVRRVKKIMGDPLAELPKMGDLDYCEPGQGLFDRLASYDKYRAWRSQTAWTDRDMKDVTQEERESGEVAAAKMTAWWDDMVSGVLDEHKSAVKRAMDEVSGASRRSGQKRGHLTDEESTKAMHSLFVDRDE